MSESMETLFNNLFTGAFVGSGSYEDKQKSQAFLRVISKSAASLSDMVSLADSLGFSIELSLIPKPGAKDQEPTK